MADPGGAAGQFDDPADAAGVPALIATAPAARETASDPCFVRQLSFHKQQNLRMADSHTEVFPLF